MKLRIVVTTGALAKRTGAALYVRDLCIRLAELGHDPAAFTCLPGEVSAELEALGIRVVSDTDTFVEKPDIIHGQYRMETLMVSLRFPRVPVVSVCHGALRWAERPPVLPSIRRYAAVDFASRERVARDIGVIKDQMPVLHNFVDLRRLPLRSSLPERPTRALAFGEDLSEGSPIPYLREACRRAGVDLDVVGERSGRTAEHPDDLLVNYDLVFASERMALEALAVGCAVILCDQTGVGKMVSRGEIEEMRDWNFGNRLLADSPMPRAIERQIAAYDAKDALACTEYVRLHCGQEPAVDKILALYREVVQEAKDSPAVDARAVGEAAAHELTKIRKEMGDHIWQLDQAPPLSSRGKPSEPKPGLKAIANRFGWPRR